jgi:hypothetical protein
MALPIPKTGSTAATDRMKDCSGTEMRHLLSLGGVMLDRLWEIVTNPRVSPVERSLFPPRPVAEPLGIRQLDAANLRLLMRQGAIFLREEVISANPRSGELAG